MNFVKWSILIAIIILPSNILCQGLNIIPYPEKIERHEGFFDLNSNTVITHSKNLHLKAKQLKEYLDPATGFDIKIGNSDIQSNQLLLEIN